MNWRRAFLCGVLGAVFLMTFIDIFAALGMTSFSFEWYIGSLLVNEPYPHHVWMAGFLANALLGGVFGFMYAYFFEYVFFRATARSGALVGLIHAIFAAVAFFPFFQVVHESIDTGVFREFGFLGTGLDAQTPILLFMGHILFGLSVGVFYGPVRSARVRERYFEPGVVSVPRSNHAEDRAAV